MSYGFEIYNGSGTKVFSDADLSYVILDTFQVSPTATGSKTYTDMGNYQFLLTQTAVEPTTTTIAQLMSFNTTTLTWSSSGTNRTVYWAPGKQLGTLYNVQVYVLGY